MVALCPLAVHQPVSGPRRAHRRRFPCALSTAFVTPATVASAVPFPAEAPRPVPFQDALQVPLRHAERVATLAAPIHTTAPLDRRGDVRVHRPTCAAR